ncbi:MAG: AAA family ATPase, partial [Terriglobia bacterium]
MVENGAQCVLCQQNLDHAASHRLHQFEAFVVSRTEQELRESRDKFAEMQKGFVDFKTTNEAAEEAIEEIRVERQPLADKLSSFLASSETRRNAVVDALASGQQPALPEFPSVSQDAEAVAGQLEQRAKTLRSSADAQQKASMTAEAQELRARKLLAAHEKQVLEDIERRKKVAAYELCLNDIKTQAITQKSAALTKTAVTQNLIKSFKAELDRLGFRQLEIELKDIGGEQGVLYHKLILTRAPGVELPKVVSEGEQRCLSIAAFFAELSTADDPSAIVFDDPVSSLDYKWREGVARRLVEEARTRQVIVFTHDIVFLLLLKKFSEDLSVQQLDQHVRQLPQGAGVCAEELPWVAMPVKEKIGHLKNAWQAADKLHRE